MGVFDPRQGQVFVKPVDAYYQGEAMRQSLAAGEQDAEIRGLQIDAAKQELEDAPARKAAANAKAAADYALVLETLRGKSTANDIAERDQAKDIISPWIAEYDEKGIDWARDNFDEMVLARLPEGTREGFSDAKGPDGILDEGDMAKIGLMIAVHEVDKSPDPTSHQKHLAQLRDDGYITPEKYNEILLAIEEKAATIVGRTPEDVAADPRTPTQVGAAYEEARAKIQDSGVVIEMISAGLPEVTAMPGTVGFRGKLGLNVAGLASSLGQDDLANWAAETIAGADAETIAAMTTRLQVLRSQLIPIVTGEEGSRISENEREIAGRAVGVIDEMRGPADLTKAYPQVIGAMRQLMEESWVSIYMTAKDQEKIDYPYDLSTKEGILEWQEIMVQAGMDEQSTKRTFARLKKIQGVL